MDETELFLELSALLTGLYDSLLNDPEARELNLPIAEEYIRKLRGTYPIEFPALLEAYKSLATANPKPPIDDALLATLRATPEFSAKDAIVARQIVNIWYLSQFEDQTGELLDGGFYEHGNVWPLIKAHPIGFSNQLHGYWTSKP
ncbi:MAG TPA: hypothetical protein VJM12_04555 [Pyrinomonadaceae bacterium]|nr:hypothetical protein [Pyrinomonadaceae bacterium]